MTYSIDLDKAAHRDLPRKVDLTHAGMSDTEAQQLVDSMFESQYAGGMSRPELRDFETLISRLEGSKMRQAAQSNRARERGIFAGGLASMMGNF